MATIGLTGLGTMGAALSLNIAENGYDIAVHNRSEEKIDALIARAGDLADRLTAAPSMAELAEAIEKPRVVIVMVPSFVVDDVIGQLTEVLDEGDTIVDAGNADFNDTRRREKELTAKGFNFVGMGVSGGEEGARHGPSIMVGGPEESWERLGPIVRAIAADYEGDPCAARHGPDGAGHFVKTVHNGIEYADMQLIAEVYGLCRDGLGQDAAEIGAMFADWNRGRLRSYLVEITAEVLGTTDSESGKALVDVILDQAGQKGTGRWTVIEALKLGQSATAIEAAVAARSFSAERRVRKAGAAALGAGGAVDLDLDPADLAPAFLAGRIVAYAQGLAVLAEASDHFDWGIDLARVAEIWRAGCIIRSALLDDIAAAVRDSLPEGRLILSPAFAKTLSDSLPALRRVAAAGIAAGLPVPALSAAVAYYDTMRQPRGTANLIQGQRDFFGRHGFERTDKGGEGLHGPWAEE